eukprot:15443597-Alexandrium_andersonii.AAC.1
MAATDPAAEASIGPAAPARQMPPRPPARKRLAPASQDGPQTKEPRKAATPEEIATGWASATMPQPPRPDAAT